MVKLALKDEGIDLNKVYIVPVPDILMNCVWVHYLSMYVPKFKYGIARNPLVIRLFKEAGYEVLIPPPYNRGEYSSTKIRKLMLLGDSKWKDLVPRSVVEFIEEIRGVERLKQVVGVD
jgi:nicotinamide-nucleotide adenylyltransferase